MADNDKEQEKIESLTADELHVGSMSVDTLKANVYVDLAGLTATLEKQGKEQLRALTRLSSKKTGNASAKPNGQNKAASGMNSDNKSPSSNHKQKAQKSENGNKKTISGNQETVNGIDMVSRRSATLQQVDTKRRIVVLDDPNKAINGKNNTVDASANVEPVTHEVTAYNPAQARKKRTIEMSSVPDGSATQATSKPSEKPPEQETKGGNFYMDAQGRLRRPDGKYANKIEVRRYSRERNQDIDEKNAAKDGAGSGKQLGLLAKTFAKLTGKAASTDAADAAGVTTGGSYWLAAKELSGMASNFKESLQLRKINSMKDAKAYAKDKASRVGSVLTAPVRAGKRLVNRITGKKKPAEDVSATTPVPAKVSAVPVNNSKAAYDQGLKEKSDDARSEKQLDVVEANHEETQQVLEEILDELKPKKSSLMDTFASGKKMLDMVRGRGGKRTAGRSQRGKVKRGKVGGLVAAEEVFDELADDTQGLDLNSNGSDDKAKGKAGKDGKVKGTREARAKGRKVPKIGGKAGVAKRPVGLLSKMLGVIPEAMSAVPSVATAAGVTGGKILPAMETVGKGVAKAGKGAAAVGKGALELTGKGMLASARALPLVGQALSVGLAGYDAYNGYNDTEAQKGIFNLKDGQEANTLQKSSTAAASVLDMGGLTSGVSGLLGDLAGFVGLKNTQEALTFDSGDMAKTMYDSVTGESARKALGVQDGKDMSIGQNIASSTASVLDMGGLTSFLSKGIGSLVEDMGVTGAKDAMSFDAGGIAKALYTPFSDTGAVGSLAKSVTEFSSDSIVGAITDLIGVVKRGSGDTSINNFSSASSWGASGPASNWSGTAKGVGVPADIQQQERDSGLPAGYLGGVLGVESGGNPNAINKQSGAAGMWQFMPKTAAGLGGFNPLDPKASTQAMIKFTKQNGEYFQKTMGREATGRELYLMHQQGMGGGTKLMKNPDASAASVVGAKAVTQNGGNLNMTARQFAELQMSKYDRQVAANQTAAPLRIGADTKGVKGIPPMLARPEAVTATSTIPTLLQRPITAPADIQKARDEKKGNAADAPQDPLVAKLDPAMTKSLNNIESLLKQQAKASNAGPASGGQGSGRNSPVSGHDYVSGHMSDLVRDRG